jgi:hypothetical protein
LGLPVETPTFDDMTRSRNPVLACLALAAALVLPLAPAATATTAPPPTVPVAPSALPEGPAATPAARLLDGKLLRPGKPDISIASLGQYPKHLSRVRGGYLIDFALYQGSRLLGYKIVFISDSGHQKTLVNRSSYWVERVSTNGRTYVGARQRHDKHGKFVQGEVLRRFRTSDARAFGKTLTVADYPAMFAVTPTRVLLGYVPLNGRHAGEPRTIWWNNRTGNVRVVTTDSHRRSQMPAGVQAASMGTHAFSVIKHGRQVVLDTQTGKRLWKTSTNEAVWRFSPDHKKVVTLAGVAHVGEEESDDYVAQRMSVRNARTGRLLVTFTGLFEADSLPPGANADVGLAPPHWESADTYVTYAYDRLTDPSWPTPEGRAAIRCRVSTATCERVHDDGALDGMWATPPTQ